MCPRGGLSHYRLAQGDDGEHPACSESVILPMCNVIYLGMQRYLSRGPRARERPEAEGGGIAVEKSSRSRRRRLRT